MGEDLNGVLVVDKPPGMTSHDVVQKVRRIALQKRVGHAGTLDPDATGVLLICLGHATRLFDHLAGRGKVYEATLQLGKRTSTEDASGTVLAVSDSSGIVKDDLAAALLRFTGLVEQVPPMVSAVHHQGQRLYELARHGVEVERAARTVEIQSLELLDFRPGPEATAALRISCGKGTYVRTLCADIGNALGVGGYMAQLRRTAVGDHDISCAVPLDRLTPSLLAQSLTSCTDAVGFLDVMHLDDQAARDVLNGKSIKREGDIASEQTVRLEWNGELIALASLSDDDRLHPHPVFVPATAPPLSKR